MAFLFTDTIFYFQILDYVECFCSPNIKAMHTMLINKPPDSGMSIFLTYVTFIYMCVFLLVYKF